jgi:hypothetical protein
MRPSLTTRVLVIIKCPGGATNSPRRDHLLHQAMINHRPLPPLERLDELFEVVEIPPDKYGEWSGLVRKLSRGGKRAGSIAGSPLSSSSNPDRVNWLVGVDGSYYYASRVIYYMVYREDPGDVQVDHKDQNWLNNNARNLRLDVDGSVQPVNKPTYRNNTSGVVGVCWHKATRKWAAQAMIKGKRKHLGLFTCKVEAARVVRDKCIEMGWHKKGRKLPDLDKVQCDCGRCSLNS